MKGNDFINSIPNKVFSKIRGSQGDAECRRVLMEHLLDLKETSIEDEVPTVYAHTLEVGEFIDALLEVIPQGQKMKYLDKVVKYDFIPGAGGLNLDSWRGAYSQLTLDYSFGGKDVTLGELLDDLESSVKGRVFHGYKGGEFRMNLDTSVWADVSGMYTRRIITGVEDRDDCILLKTAFTEVDY